jgi:predicted transcriptional regulator
MTLILFNLQIRMILRNSYRIIAEILECAQRSQGISKTRIMYEVELSFTQIKEYLNYLQQCELVSCKEEYGIFRTTNKGKKFLKLYNDMTNLLPVSQK